jgi:hypothetical protein
VNENPDRSPSTEAPGPEEERELRAVAQLLRGLSDPQPPDDLVQRVMAEVSRRESGPRVIRAAFGRLEPLVATAVAAGIGTLVLWTAMEGGLFPAGELRSGLSSGAVADAGLVPTPAHRVDDASTGYAAPARRRLTPLPAFVPGSQRHTIQQLGLTPSTALRGPEGIRWSLTHPVDRSLDFDLNSLLLDPEAFYAELEQRDAPEGYVARLADRAARRGDAAEVAMILNRRSPDHPQTAVMVDRLLRATIARTLPRR